MLSALIFGGLVRPQASYLPKAGPVLVVTANPQIEAGSQIQVGS